MTRAAEIAKIIGKGSVDIHGEAGTTSSASTGKTTNLQQGLLKAWANLDGSSTVGVNDSFNTTGITDNGTGDSTIAMTSTMGDANYIQIGNTVHDSGSYVAFNSFDHDGPSTTSNVIMNCCLNSNGSLHDGEHQMVVLHGDLA